MKTPLLSRWLCLLTCVVAPWLAQADVVKLKDGSTVEGEVVSQTETEVVVEKSFAGGSIRTKETIERSKIAEIVLATAAEKSQRAAQQAYDALQKYQLNPLTSQPKAYYDQVIEGVFRKFLTDFPDSPRVNDVVARISDWEAEREKVAAGQAKLNGQWLPADEAERLTAQERAQTLLQQAQTLLAAKQFGQAIERLDQIIISKTMPGMTEVATRLRTEAYQQWYVMLTEQKKKLEEEIPATERAIADAQKRIERAQAAMRGAGSGGFKSSGGTSGGSSKMSKKGGAVGGSSGDVTKMGGGGTAGTSQAVSELGVAQAEKVKLETQLPVLRAQLEDIKRLLPQMQTKAREAGIEVVSAVATATVAVATAPPPASGPAEDDLLGNIAEWFKKYWPYAAVGFVIVLWYVTKRLGQ
jgi:hypothetical protein